MMNENLLKKDIDGLGSRLNAVEADMKGEAVKTAYNEAHVQKLWDAVLCCG